MRKCRGGAEEAVGRALHRANKRSKYSKSLLPAVYVTLAIMF